MSNTLDTKDIQQCFDCLYCHPIGDKHYCTERGEETQLNNHCKEYDYCGSDWYAGA